jgi:lysophospholipase L1-like esterase
MSIPVKVARPDDVLAQAQPFDPAPYGIRLLAQGDSWFSFGALPPMASSNLFDGMHTQTLSACAINCAHPGRELQLMTNHTTEPMFVSFLSGLQAREWTALLVSGGGNDLIAAVQQPAGAPEWQRLLLNPAEWGPAEQGAERYLSASGWQTFSGYLTAAGAQLLALRDQGPNRGIPVLMHTYDLAVPRNAGAGAGVGPWLYTAVRAFQVPEADWQAVAAALLGRLKDLLAHLAATTPDGSLHVIDTQGMLSPARTSDTGATADWENEIHPTRAGYRLLAGRWSEALIALFDAAAAPALADAAPLRARAAGPSLTLPGLLRPRSGAEEIAPFVRRRQALPASTPGRAPLH